MVNEFVGSNGDEVENMEDKRIDVTMEVSKQKKEPVVVEVDVDEVSLRSFKVPKTPRKKTTGKAIPKVKKLKSSNN